MPVRKVKLKDGSIGYQWGTTGKIYKKREDAEKQGIAILLSQRKKRKMKISRQTYNELKDRLNKLEKLVNGGPGSGNFGHVGRPGKQGGSAPSDTSTQSDKLDERVVEFSKKYSGPSNVRIGTAYSISLDKDDPQTSYFFHTKPEMLAFDSGVQAAMRTPTDKKASTHYSRDDDKYYAVYDGTDMKLPGTKGYVREATAQKVAYGFEAANERILGKKVNSLEKLVNGGEGSGNFGHAGRPGKIGGSAPEGETSKKEAPKNPVKEVDAQISKLDEVEKELSKDTSIGATPALMDKIYVTDGDKKLAKKLGADVEVAERWAEQIASEKGYLRTRQMTTGFDFPIREKFDYDQLFKFSPEHALEIRRAFWDSVKDQLESQ